VNSISLRTRAVRLASLHALPAFGDLRPILSTLAFQVALYGLFAVAGWNDGAIFNLDLLLIQSAWVLSGRLRGVLFSGAVLLYAIDMVASKFLFDLVPFVRQVLFVTPDILWANLHLMVGGIVLAVAAYLFSRRIGVIHPIHAVLAVMCLISLDLAQGSSAAIPLNHRIGTFGRIDVVTSELNKLRVQLLHGMPVVVAKTARRSPSALVTQPTASSHVILVIVESLGVPRGKGGEPGLGYASILSRHAKLILNGEGLVPAHGGTVSGELRELCGLAISSIARLDSYAACAPHTFVRRGYRTIAVHSYRGSMFDRRDWWPMAGFQSVTFKDERLARYPTCARTLNSLCDKAMLPGELEQALRLPSSFFYYLSSNSHLPVPAGYTTETLLAEALDDVLQGVETALDRAKPESAVVFLVGDHPPPAIGFGKYNYEAGIVPYWRFTWRRK
jgi:hypothetical protein